MVEIQIGTVISLASAKYGANEKGNWMFVKYVADTGKEDISVFVHGKNAQDARYWKSGKVTKILRVGRQARLVNGKWYTNVIATVEMIEGPLTYAKKPQDDFLTPPPDDLDGLPFA